MILVYILINGWKVDLKYKKESMKWIGNNLFILNTKDVILYDTSINTINENESMIILTTNTGNYRDSALTTSDNNNNNYNKSNNNWTSKERSRKNEVKYFERKRK